MPGTYEIYKNSSTNARTIKMIDVDPETGTVRGATGDGSLMSVSVGGSGSAFTWPQVDEFWVIQHDNGSWRLVGKRTSLEDPYPVTSLQAGQTRIDGTAVFVRGAQVTRKFSAIAIAEAGVSPMAIVSHHLGTTCVTCDYYSEPAQSVLSLGYTNDSGVLDLEDATDFDDSGKVYLDVENYQTLTYTGKTDNQLTGVAGSEENVSDYPVEVGS